MKTSISRARSHSISGGTTAARSPGRICRLCQRRESCVWTQHSILFASPRVQKKLLVSFGPRQVAGLHADDFKTGFARRCSHAIDGFSMQRLVSDDSALADVPFFQLELRLYKNQKIGSRRPDSHNRL